MRNPETLFGYGTRNLQTAGDDIGQICDDKMVRVGFRLAKLCENSEFLSEKFNVVKVVKINFFWMKFGR